MPCASLMMKDEQQYYGLQGMDIKNAGRFFIKIWPREKRFQTATTSESMAGMAIDAGDLFPRIVDIISDFLVPFGNIASVMFGLTSSAAHDEHALYKRFFKETIKLLDALFDTSAAFVPVNFPKLLNGFHETIRFCGAIPLG